MKILVILKLFLFTIISVNCTKTLTGLILYHRNVPSKLAPGSCLNLLYFGEHDGSNVTLKQTIVNPSREKHTSYLFNIHDAQASFQAIQINLNVGWCSHEGHTKFHDFTSGPLEKGKFTPVVVDSSTENGPAILVQPVQDPTDDMDTTGTSGTSSERLENKKIGGLITYDKSVPKLIPHGSCLVLEYFAKHSQTNTTMDQIIHNPSKERHATYLFTVPNIKAEYEAIRITLNIGWCSKDGDTHEDDFTSGTFHEFKIPSSTNSRKFGPAIHIVPVNRFSTTAKPITNTRTAKSTKPSNSEESSSFKVASTSTTSTTESYLKHHEKLPDEISATESTSTRKNPPYTDDSNGDISYEPKKQKDSRNKGGDSRIRTTASTTTLASSLSSLSNSRIRSTKSTTIESSDDTMDSTKSTTTADSDNELGSTKSTATTSDSDNDLWSTKSTTAVDNDNDLWSTKSTTTADSDNDLWSTKSTTTADSDNNLWSTKSTTTANGDNDLWGTKLTAMADGDNQLWSTKSTTTTDSDNDLSGTKSTTKAAGDVILDSPTKSTTTKFSYVDTLDSTKSTTTVNNDDVFDRKKSTTTESSAWLTERKTSTTSSPFSIEVVPTDDSPMTTQSSRFATSLDSRLRCPFTCSLKCCADVGWMKVKIAVTKNAADRRSIYQRCPKECIVETSEPAIGTRKKSYIRKRHWSRHFHG